ncbi:DUF3048 domain-containing protein [Streptomyces kanamyceticus]|uniref:DUF3048 domain-containing protein n=1 Tax=Streptomyces kanamyceticus TaxID=1967 RepID=A0A5J6GKX1_STRKN|nr:DUF3048 domain-containing protein [Streptomyces kanamyceticus]QEU96560.1 DUF3048 domain-containing protein [Streptomyces kanamyceticus]
MAATTQRAARSTRLRATALALAATAALAVGAVGAPSHATAPARGDAAPHRGPSPFTGLTAPQGPVLAVKFDNARGARPHTGLDKADIVYVEKVEGGMSRLMGVYSSKLPKTVGPVRSARESDIELLRQFGHPALAYSGVRSSLQKVLRDSPLYARPHGRAPGAYFRNGYRTAPHNLFLRPAALLRTAPRASRPTDIGFRFGPAPKGGTPTERRTVRYASASHTFRWSPRQGRWLASFDGAPARSTSGSRLGARTIVIQYVTMRPSRYKDVNGAVTPYIETVGSGKALVLRDGKRYATHWKRSAATGGTSFTLANGRPMPFAPGQVWMVYADRR